MGRYRQREIEIDLPDGQEIRVTDAPVSEPIKNLTIDIIPLYDGPKTPAGAGNVIVKTFYGGGYGQPAKAYAVPNYETGIQQGSTVTLPANTITFPLTVFQGSTNLEIFPADRVRDGWRVREDGNRARALHIYNNCGGGAPLRCKVVFVSETVSESG